VVPVDEHRCCRVDGGAVANEAALPPSEGSGGVGIEVDAASVGAGLDGRFDGAAGGDLSRADDRQARRPSVEVAPVQSGEFAAADSGVGDKVQRWVEALGLGHLKELADLG